MQLLHVNKTCMLILVAVCYNKHFTSVNSCLVLGGPRLMPTSVHYLDLYSLCFFNQIFQTQLYRT